MKTYRRSDIRLDLLAHGGDVLLRRTGPGRRATQARLPREALEAAAGGDLAALRAALSRHAASAPPPPNNGDFHLRRVTLAVAERAWAAIDWESLAGGHRGLVRICDVRARVQAVPLTFPLRVLEGGGPPVVQHALEATFGTADRSRALLNATTTAEDVAAFPARTGWPTVEVLHLHEGDLMVGPRDRLAPWLEGFVERYQTRLVIVESSDPVEARLLRQCAQALVERAGPAVWVLPRPQEPAAWAALYAGLAHDRPLDWIFAQRHGNGAPEGGALFVGGAREELLRYSALAAAVRTLPPAPLATVRKGVAGRHTASATAVLPTVRQSLEATALAMKVPFAGDRLDLQQLRDPQRARFGAAAAARMASSGIYAPAAEAAVHQLRRQAPDLEQLARAAARRAVSMRRVPDPTAAVADALRAVGRTRGLRFEDHESEGLLPLADRLAVARGVAQTYGGLKAAPPRAPRHVNIAFFRGTPQGPLERIAQRGARLRPGQLVHLGIQIGARDALTVTLGQSALVQELDRAGATLALEVGVSGLDFEVVGDPVQPLLLEPGRPSPLLAFAVRPVAQPTVPGIARLRVTLFRQNHLVQSFLVAAVLEGHAPQASPLAKALATPAPALQRLLRRAGPLGYLQRLEFSMAAPADAGALPRRGLTLVANDSAGEKVLTVKANDLFTVHRSTAFAGHTTTLRTQLDRMAVDAFNVYAYRYQDIDNAGDPQRLVDVLWPLAAAGWDLCATLLPDPDGRAAVRQRLLADGGLQAAHLVASDVIPWSLVYDRRILRPPPNEEPGLWKPHLCPAGLPGPLEGAAAGDCGTRPACLLTPSPENGGATARPEEVLCPLRFWGFRVPVEVPAHQAEGIAGKPPPPVRTTIEASTPVRVAAAFNATLELARSHAAALQAGLRAGQALLLQPAPSGPPDARRVLDLLDSSDPDVVYLYCHGLPRLPVPAGTIGPGLHFGPLPDANAPDTGGLIVASDLVDTSWARAPLVFMNGCSTAGFSASEPAELVRAFVQGRRASAVVGTEVSVRELLACEFALRFFDGFVRRRLPAGRALLAARRELLAKHNPLGLVYTLYGSSALSLPPAPPGQNG